MSQQATLKNQQTIKTLMAPFPNVTNLMTNFTAPFVRWLCVAIQPIFEAEPNVVEVASPVHIVGDIHGQLKDLLSIFQINGIPPKEKYVFLGDYVDRGKHSVEVICLLFILKYLYPNNIILLRGNHESREMTKSFGFAKECRSKLNKQCRKYFCLAFDKMPLCAIVDKKAFCVHGGISPSLSTVDDIMEISRFCEIPDNGLFCDILWSDPSATCKEWEPSDRGETFIWGLEAAKKFLNDNNLDMIVRGHQVANEGYDFPFRPDNSVVTVFSATNYAEECINKGTVMTIKENEPPSFTEIPFELPSSRATSRGPLSPEMDSLKAKRKRKGAKKKKAHKY